MFHITEEIHHGNYFHVSHSSGDTLEEAVKNALAASTYNCKYENAYAVLMHDFIRAMESNETNPKAEFGWARYYLSFYDGYIN